MFSFVWVWDFTFLPIDSIADEKWEKICFMYISRCGYIERSKRLLEQLDFLIRWERKKAFDLSCLIFTTSTTGGSSGETVLKTSISLLPKLYKSSSRRAAVFKTFNRADNYSIISFYRNSLTSALVHDLLRTCCEV